MDSVSTSPKSEYYSIDEENPPKYDNASVIKDSTDPTDTSNTVDSASAPSIDRPNTVGANKRSAGHSKSTDSTSSADTTVQIGLPAAHTSQVDNAQVPGRKDSQSTAKRSPKDDFVVVDNPNPDNNTTQSKSPELLPSAELENDQEPTSAATASGSSRANSTSNGAFNYLIDNNI